MLQVFNKDNMNLVIKKDNGVELFDVESVGKSLGFVESKNGKEYVRWNRINGHLNVSPQVEKGDLITESQVYQLMFKAKNDIAQKFQNWLASEVLPQIRKTGGYIPIDEGMSEMEILARALIISKKTIDQKDEIIKSQGQIVKQKEEHIEVLKPMADSYNNYLSLDGLTTIDDFSKKLAIKNFGRNNLYSWMRSKKFLQVDNIPYARYVNSQQYFVVKDTGYRIDKHTDKKIITQKTLLTASGVDFLLKRLAQDGYTPSMTA